MWLISLIFSNRFPSTKKQQFNLKFPITILNKSYLSLILFFPLSRDLKRKYFIEILKKLFFNSCINAAWNNTHFFVVEFQKNFSFIAQKNVCMRIVWIISRYSIFSCEKLKANFPKSFSGIFLGGLRVWKKSPAFLNFFSRKLLDIIRIFRKS